MPLAELKKMDEMACATLAACPVMDVKWDATRLPELFSKPPSLQNLSQVHELVAMLIAFFKLAASICIGATMLY